MAARILPIEPGRGPSADIAAPHYGGRSPVLSTGAGVESLGASLGNAAAILQRQEDVRKVREDMLALNDAHVEQSSFARQQDETMRQMQQDWNGDPSSFHEKYMDQYDAQAKALVNGTQNEKAKLFLRAQTASMGVLAQHSALNWQAQAQVHYYGDQHKQILENYIPMAGRDESLYQPLVDQINEFTDGLRLPQPIKETMRELTKKSIGDATLTGFAERNPEEAVALFRKALGIKEAPPQPATAETTRGAYSIAVPTEIKSAADAEKLTPMQTSLLAAIYGQESSSGADARTSAAGAVGPGQVMPATFVQFADKGWDINNKEQNLRVAARYVKFLGGLTGEDPRLIAAGYYSGEGAVKGGAIALRSPPAGIPGPTNVGYADQVLGRMGVQQVSPTDAVRANVNAIMTTSEPASEFATTQVGSLQSTGMDWIDKQPPQKIVTELHHSEALLNSGRADARHELTVATQNAAAQAEHGISPSFPDPSLIERAVGAKQAPEVLKQFEVLRNYGGAMAQVQTMTPQQMSQTYENLVPLNVNDTNWAAKAKYAEQFKAASVAVFKARQADPMGAAREQGLGKINDIEWRDQEKAVAEFVSRTALAVRNHDVYGGNGYSALTKSEAAQYGPTWHTLTTEQQLGIFSMLKQGIKDDRVYRDTTAAFVKDAPAVLRAAEVMDRQQSDPNLPSGRDLAFGLLKGERLLSPDKYAKAEDGQGKPYALPKTSGADGMDAAIAKQIGSAFIGQAQDFHETVQEIHRYYAYLAALEGEYGRELPDTTILDKAVKTIAGTAKWSRGIFSSVPVVMPFGMTESQFRPALVNSYEAAMRAGGIAGTVVDNPEALKPMRVSEYVYRFTNGSKLLTGLNGRPIEADVSSSEYGPPLTVVGTGTRSVTGRVR